MDRVPPPAQSFITLCAPRASTALVIAFRCLVSRCCAMLTSRFSRLWHSICIETCLCGQLGLMPYENVLPCMVRVVAVLRQQLPDGRSMCLS